MENKSVTRERVGCSLGIILLVIAALLLLLGCSFLRLVGRDPEVYETNLVEDYGYFTGNYDDSTPRQYIMSFFPDTIQESFSNITYHYKAKKFDTYAFEAYLEFTVSDPKAFFALVEEYTQPEKCARFFCDESYMAYRIDHEYEITKHIYDSVTRYAIEYAKIGYVLYSVSEQRFIFVALGVYDGGGTSTDELCNFFDRFGIDPVKFATGS